MANPEDTAALELNPGVEEDAPATGPESAPERKTSTGSGDIQLSRIQVIVRPRSDTEEEEEEEEKPKKKKTVKRKKKKAAPQGKPEPTPAEVLTKTLAQALRLINEQKVRLIMPVLKLRQCHTRQYVTI